MDEKPLSIGDWVKVTAGPSEGGMGKIFDLAGKTAGVQFPILGGGHHAETIPLVWLRRARPDELGPT